MQPDPRLASVIPVVFGGDVGAYTLGLECYEGFNARPICVAHEPVDLISRSRIFTVRPISARASDEERLALLRQIVEESPGRPRILLTNNDGVVAFFTRHREQLQQDWAIPYPDYSIVQKLLSKEYFAELCDSVDVLTPPTQIVDLSAAGKPGWRAAETTFDFPVVAKADSSDEYEAVSFPGKKKIWYIDTPQELSRLWESLEAAGFRGKFLVQPIIPGDDTNKRTVTLYVDQNDRVTLRASGQVLLEDPSPTMIGNPSVMICREMPDLLESAEKVLRACGYRGFANFDLKVDPRTGKAYFFELNPRAGRSSYFIMAGGINPMVTMARDLILGERVEPQFAKRWALYTLFPLSLVRKYVTEPKLREEVQDLARRKRVVNPLKASVESDLVRRAVVTAQGLNFYRKFKKYYRVDEV